MDQLSDGKVTIRLFGNWQERAGELERSEDGRDAVAFLLGKVDTLSPAAALVVRRLFHAQNTCRESLECQVEMAARVMKAEAVTAQDKLAVPQSTDDGTSEQFAMGRAAGLHEAYGACEQLLMSGINSAWLEAEEDKR